jgi:hypothetical protein
VGLDTAIPAAVRSRTTAFQLVPGSGVINTAIEGFRCSVDESFESSKQAIHHIVGNKSGAVRLITSVLPTCVQQNEAEQLKGWNVMVL